MAQPWPQPLHCARSPPLRALPAAGAVPMGVPEPPRWLGRGLPHHARGQAGVGGTVPTPSALLVSPGVWHLLGCSGSVRLSILQVNIVGFLPKTPSWGQPLQEELKPSASPGPGDPSVAFWGGSGPGALQDGCTDTAPGSWGVLPCQSLPSAHLPAPTLPQRPGSAPGAPCPRSPRLSPWAGHYPHGLGIIPPAGHYPHGLPTLLAMPCGAPGASDHPPEHCARLQPARFLLHPHPVFMAAGASPRER